MKKLETRLWNPSFSHIYVEKEAFLYPLTSEIIGKLNSKIIEIDRYKDVFSNSNQNFSIQKNSPKLILAVKKDNYLYKGAEVCQSFENSNFYYTSSIMNCLYNCEYCYLQGVYNSGNIVVFVNINEMFEEIKKILLEKKNLYICISYDTDLLAIDNLIGLVELWYQLLEKNSDLKIELRTKSINISKLKRLKPLNNFIIAYTLSPEQLSIIHEMGTPPFKKRLKAIKELIELGWNIRLCFDPLLYIKNFEKHYSDMINECFNIVDGEKILDISIGSFRISKEYLKRMRKNNPNSLILSYPFSCKDGVYSYDDKRNSKIIEFVKNQLIKYVPVHKIYININ